MCVIVSYTNDSFAESQVSKIKVLSVSCTGIENADVDIISYHILKFSHLDDLDVSSNSLDTAAVNRMISTFAGNATVCTLYTVFFSVLPSVTDTRQENALETMCIH